MNEQIKKFAFESAGGLLRFDERGFMLYEDELEKFAELVRADEREACAKLVEETLEPWLLKEYIEKTVQAIKGGAEKQDPDSDIYDIWVEQKPVHASDISQERVDETAKRKHEWVGLTDGEKEQLVEKFYGTDIQRLEAIEAILKEKNQ